MTQTVLDRAHAAMTEAPEDEAARLNFHARIADAELFLLLSEEPDGDDLSPEVFALSDARYVLVFDSEERLAGFADRIAPYAALSGRALVTMLAGQGIGLGLNLDVAPSSILIGPEGVDWMHRRLAATPQEARARPQEITAPQGVPEPVLAALTRGLASAAGLADGAWLAGVRYADGQRADLLGFLSPRPGAEPALAQVVNEALSFSGVEAGALDVVFLAPQDALAAAMARHGIRFDLPAASEPGARQAPSAPGMDPDRPPILR